MHTISEKAQKSEYSRDEMIKFGYEKQKYANNISNAHRHKVRIGAVKEARAEATRRRTNANRNTPGSSVGHHSVIILPFSSNEHTMITVARSDGKALSLKTAR